MNLTSNWQASPASIIWHVCQWVGTVALLGGFIALFVEAQLRSVSRNKAFRGPASSGIAEVLSAAREGGLGATFSYGNGYRGVLCRIVLRVQLPERAPYEATGSTPVESRVLVDLCVDGQRWEVDQRWNIKPHKVFTAQVDSANPQDVRVDFRRPIPQD